MKKSIDFQKEKRKVWSEMTFVLMFAMNFLRFHYAFFRVFGWYVFILVPPVAFWMIVWIWSMVLIKRRTDNSFWPIFRIRRILCYVTLITYIIMHGYIFFFCDSTVWNIFE